MKKINTIDRRSFIKNAAYGAASASMLNSFASRAMAADNNIKRVIVWYVPEGCAQQAFWPVQTGKLAINSGASINGQTPQSKGSSIRGYIDHNQATYCLQPLMRHINDISLYSGFKNPGGGASDPHAKVVNYALTGGNQGAGSFDQIMGQKLKGSNPISSIYLPVYGHHVKNGGAAHSYMSPARKIGGGTLGSANWNPMDTYVQLFPTGVPAPNTDNSAMMDEYNQHKARVSILKSIESQLGAVKCQGGAEAAQKMEVLLAAYQKLENDTQAIIDSSGQGIGSDVRFDIPNGWENTAGTRTDGSKYWNQSQNFGKLVDIAIDTTVAALALDKTRVSLMQFSASGTKQGPVGRDHYKHVGIQGLEGGTNYDHHLGHSPDAVRRRDQARIFRWYYSKLAYLIDRLKDIPDGAGTMFDSTVIITATEFSMYNHRSNDMPYMVCGGLGGKLKTGQYLDARQGGNFRNHADFFLGVARALEVDMPRFGNSSNPYMDMLA